MLLSLELGDKVAGNLHSLSQNSLWSSTNDVTTPEPQIWTKHHVGRSNGCSWCPAWSNHSRTWCVSKQPSLQRNSMEIISWGSKIQPKQIAASDVVTSYLINPSHPLRNKSHLWADSLLVYSFDHVYGKLGYEMWPTPRSSETGERWRPRWYYLSVLIKKRLIQLSRSIQSIRMSRMAGTCNVENCLFVVPCCVKELSMVPNIPGRELLVPRVLRKDLAFTEHYARTHALHKKLRFH